MKTNTPKTTHPAGGAASHSKAPVAAHKKVFDVSRPGKAPASPTSRPVIVGHNPSVQRNQISVSGVGERDTAAPEARAQLLSSHKRIEPLGTSAAATAADPSTSDLPGAPALPPSPVAAAAAAALKKQEAKEEPKPEPPATPEPAADQPAPDAEPSQPTEKNVLPPAPIAAAAVAVNAAAVPSAPAVPEKPAPSQAATSTSQPKPAEPPAAPTPAAPAAETAAAPPATPDKKDDPKDSAALDAIAEEDDGTFKLPIDEEAPPPQANQRPITEEPEAAEILKDMPADDGDDHQAIVVSHHGADGGKIALLIFVTLVLAAVIFDLLLDTGMLSISGIPHTHLF